ncbi:MAG TPA: EamA family transporter RarD [Marinobacterium sp.]|nr:EamA family transporter RarD [Marinobacterium sp.]
MRPYTQGLLQGTGAYTIWGGFGLYFTLLADVPSDEVLAHRVIWCLAIVAGLLLASGKLQSTLALMRQPRTLAWLTLSSILISLNWWVYIWAVAQKEVIQASLGYFLSPLIAVVLGRIFLGEKLNQLQRISVALAVIGVLWQLIALGRVPWIALSLSSLFGFYGLIRKRTPVNSISGLAVETLLVAPLALAYVYWLSQEGQNHFGSHTWALVGAGLMTAVPLLLFASAAQRLPLGTLGFLNYLAPTLQIISAIFILHEPFPLQRMISFMFIWAGLVVFSVSIYRELKSAR